MPSNFWESATGALGGGADIGASAYQASVRQKRKEEEARLKAEAEAAAAEKKRKQDELASTLLSRGVPTEAATRLATTNPDAEAAWKKWQEGQDFQKTQQDISQAPAALGAIEQRKQEEINLNTAGGGKGKPGLLRQVPPNLHQQMAGDISQMTPGQRTDQTDQMQKRNEDAAKAAADKFYAAQDQKTIEKKFGLTSDVAGAFMRGNIPAGPAGVKAPEGEKANITDPQLLSIIRQVQTETKEQLADPSNPAISPIIRVPKYPTQEEQTAEAIRRYTQSDAYINKVHEMRDQADQGQVDYWMQRDAEDTQRLNRLEEQIRQLLGSGQ